MLKEFKGFVMRGNLIEIAVAFIMGVTFATVVTAFTDVVLGFISYVFGGDVSFEGLGVKREGQIVIPYGAFLTALVTFLIVAFVLFLVVKAYNRTRAKEEATTKGCPFCATGIPIAATRCPSCTSQLQSAPA